MVEPVGIVDSVLAKNGIGHRWGCGNQLLVFPTTFDASGNSNHCTMGWSTKLHCVLWETTLFNPIVRKLVNESSGTFMAVQKLCPASANAVQDQLLKFSHQYRCIMNACIEDLNQSAVDASPHNRLEFEEISDVFYKAELVWNVCEIVYLEKPNGILPHLLEWVRVHFPGPVELAVTVLGLSDPFSNENYWKAIYGLVFQLRIDYAIQLLKQHPEFQISDSLQSAVELLKKMPILGATSSVSIPEFTFRWNHWRDECSNRIEAGDFFDSKELENLAKVFQSGRRTFFTSSLYDEQRKKILCGNEEVFDELQSNGMGCFETWYQKMVTQLTFAQPTINVSALADEADRFLAAFQGDHQTTLDAILSAVFRRDTQKVIAEMQSVLDNAWFSAHLSDLLCRAGGLQSFEDANFLQLRESLLRDYAICLFSHQSLWSLAVLYLDHCPTVGLSTLEQLLPRLLCQSEHKASKLLALAEQRKQTSVTTSICRVMGRRALSNGRLGAAVAWAVRAQDASLATYAADAVLKNYLQDSHFTSTDLLDSLGAGLLASDRLAFLGKYREFHRLYSKNEFVSAASLLISLISSRIAPMYFWTVLLMDALPLLETNPPVFSAEQTYELMQSLQELTSSFQDDTASKGYSNCQLNPDKTMLITLALARNLAKCFVQQSVCE